MFEQRQQHEVGEEGTYQKVFAILLDNGSSDVNERCATRTTTFTSYPEHLCSYQTDDLPRGHQPPDTSAQRED